LEQDPKIADGSDKILHQIKDFGAPPDFETTALQWRDPDG
jgi:hypothetical protein